MKLSIGMAHFEDFHGAVFSIQSIRMTETFHTRDIEIIVIDNSPNTEHGKSLNRFCQGVGVKYIPFEDSTGTTQTRQAIFDNATGDAVMCMDCHVLLFNDGLERLMDFYENNPETKDLYTGPLYLDNLKQQSTHFDLLWRREMWGVWGYTRECNECKYKFSYQPARDFDNLDHDVFLSMETTQRDIGKVCPQCSNNLEFSKDNKMKLSLDTEPFQIPAQGLGMFTCMKHAWLGFNPYFRHFGGEEGYIHHKFEQAGHKTMCLPFLGWWHRFSRPDGVKYPVSANSKILNYMHGYYELGLPLEDVREHFAQTGKIPSNETWEHLMNQLTDSLASGPEPAAPKKKCCGGKSNCKNKENCDKEGCSNKTVVEKRDGVSLANRSMLDIYYEFETELQRQVREMLKNSSSVVSYNKSAEYSFNVMSLDTVERYYLHHTNEDQATAIKTLCNNHHAMNMSTHDFNLEPENKDIDTLLIGHFEDDGDLDRIMAFKGHVAKNIILVCPTAEKYQKILTDWIINNRDCYLTDMKYADERKMIVMKFSKNKEDGIKAIPLNLGTIGVGCGTELKKSLKLIGIEATANCSCNARANSMDLMGVDWCEKNTDLICDWLKEEADKRRLPFIKTATKMLLKRIIRKQKRKEKKENEQRHIK